MAEPVPSRLGTRTQGSEAATCVQCWADYKHTHRPKCTDLLGGSFTHWSCGKAMQTQQNSLPTPPVAFYMKTLKTVAAVIFDPPWIATTSETWSAERCCRNTNRYDRDARPDAYWVGSSLYMFASMACISVEEKWIYLAQLLHFACLFIWLHLFPSFMLLMYFYFISKCSALHSY